MGVEHSKSLQEAACCGNARRVKAIVTATNVNTADEVEPPLDVALAHHAYSDWMHKFNLPLQDGWTPLHYGAWAGQAKAVNELLLAGADASLKEKVHLAENFLDRKPMFFKLLLARACHLVAEKAPEEAKMFAGWTHRAAFCRDRRFGGGRTPAVPAWCCSECSW